jgi:hypothetical protein
MDVSGESGSKSMSKDDLGIDDMLQHLQLNEDELEDVVLADEPINEYKKDARWLAIGKLFKKTFIQCYRST